MISFDFIVAALRYADVSDRPPNREQGVNRGARILGKWKLDRRETWHSISTELDVVEAHDRNVVPEF
jgi:hypothetical protein